MNIEEIIRKNVDVLMVTNWGENSTMSLLEKSFKEAYARGLEKAKELCDKEKEVVQKETGAYKYDFCFELIGEALDKELNKLK